MRHGKGVEKGVEAEKERGQRRREREREKKRREREGGGRRENMKGDEKDLWKNLIKNMLYGKILKEKLIY